MMSLKKIVTLALALMLALPGLAMAESAAGQGNAYFRVENADEIDIRDTGMYTVVLQPNEGWQFTVPDGTDVTGWLVDASGAGAILDSEGVALAKNGADGSLEVAIDASKISGFAHNGADDLYMMPSANSMWVAGDNKGFYKVSLDRAGRYTIPALEVVGQLDGERGSDGLVFTQDSVTLALRMDSIDDSLIDSGDAGVEIVPGDGYDVAGFEFTPGIIGAAWANGETSYTMKPEDIGLSNYGYELEAGGRGWSPLGGDGNGHYYINLGLSGIKYNGLPVMPVRFPIHVYVYGRTFTVEGGSLIAAAQPKWSTTAENELPVLCDAYPDELTATWPVQFDASALTASDFTLTLRGEYGDQLVLQAGTDYTVTSSVDSSTIVVNYIHWAFTPVYTTLTVDVNTERLNWNKQMYQVGNISHTYDIASVYAYYVLGGGMTGTLTWSFYGVDGLADWNQAFNTATYQLCSTDESGVKSYYAEDASGNGILVDAAQKALTFDASEDCRTEVRENVGFFTRPIGMTEDKTVDGATVTFNKEYVNADYSLLPPSACTGLAAKPGYVIDENSWETHLRWPWQVFVNKGYEGGTK